MITYMKRKNSMNKKSPYVSKMSLSTKKNQVFIYLNFKSGHTTEIFQYVLTSLQYVECIFYIRTTSE